MDDELSLDPEVDPEVARKKLRRRLWGMGIFLFIFSLPVLVGIYLVVRSKIAIHREQAWAVAELAKPQPNSAAYGVRGAGLLSDGKLDQALPLLTKAVEIEDAAGPKAGVKALVLLIETQLELREKDPSLSVAPIRQRIAQLEAHAVTMAQGPQAAAWHAAGKLYEHLDAKDDAVRCLSKAVELQPDDWFTEPDGQRYKHQGISSIYAKDLAGATD